MKFEDLNKVYGSSMAFVFSSIFLFLLIGSIDNDGYSLLSFNTYGELYWEIGLIIFIMITLIINQIIILRSEK